MKTKERLMWLINPFRQIAGWQALLAGLGVMALTAFLGQKSDVIFSGVLDIHEAKHSLTEAFIVQGISLLCLIFTMFIFGKLGSKSGVRFIDVAGKDGFKIVFVPCQFEKGKFNLQFTFNKENQICGFYIK